MTANDMMTLRALLAKSSEADLLRETIAFTVERPMALEVEGLAGAAHGERSPALTQRNGYRDRVRETRAGAVELKRPKRRKGRYRPGFPEPRRMAEKALTAVIREACIEGVSTRSVDGPAQAMGMSGLSGSQVSRLCGGIDDKSRDFLDARWRATGRICGGTRPVRRGARPGASSRSRSPSRRRSTTGAAARGAAWRAARPRPGPSGPRSFAPRPAAGGAASSWRSATTARASRPPRPASPAPHGSAAARTSCATGSLMPASRAGASSAPSSRPPSPRRMPTARPPRGARAPTGSGPGRRSSPLSWTRPSTMSRPV